MASAGYRSDLEARLAANIAAVEARIAAAAAQAGREPGTVTLLPVTKTAPAHLVQGLLALGRRELAESRVPDLEEKAAALAADPPVWHFIGPLQRNKARRCLRLARVLHSVESVRLLQHLDRVAGEEGLRPAVFIEVHLAEAGKHGVEPSELPALLAEARRAANLELQGLMTIGPLDADGSRVRECFAALRRLRARHCPDLPHLSMGMSQDLEAAVAEGATIVRIGSALFTGLTGGGEG